MTKFSITKSLLASTLTLTALLAQLPAAWGQPAPPADLPVVEKKVEDPFEIKAAIPNHPRLILKMGKQFTVYDQSGLMPKNNDYGCGLYKDDTRYLSEWDITLDNEPLTLLSANTEPGYAGRFIYGNKAPAVKGKEAAAEQSIVLERDIVLTDALRERLKVTNYGTTPVTTKLKVTFASDFADMFEVRGQKRLKRGKKTAGKIETSTELAQWTINTGYTGLDEGARQSLVGFGGIKPDNLSATEAVFDLKLAPGQSRSIECAVVGADEGKTAALFPPATTSGESPTLAARRQADEMYTEWCAGRSGFKTDSAAFDAMIERNFRDLFILRQSTPRGGCLAAGVPWFAVAFGRDQLITGHETLLAMPGTVKEILQTLANYQGTREDPFTEESPGRIMHELRLGEMARVKEIPFIPYYGTIDATPLFLCLLSEYVDTTGDIDFARSLWPSVQGALGYIDRELGQSRYLSYGKVRGALSNQGWKDSADSVMYSTGALAEAPIALCEVQGYLYSAWSGTARLAEKLGKKDVARSLEERAEKLKENFQKDFWMPEKDYVALALDGAGKQCDVISSNPGHNLASRILSPLQSNRVAEKLVSPAVQSGFGIRTLAQGEKAYNPISYHNGSIWPHDNALAVEGLCTAGYKNEAAKVAASIWQVGMHQADLRLPELYCGFERGDTLRPVWYPVSCSPQAWAAGTPLHMLIKLLGLEIDGEKNTLHVRNPVLPDARVMPGGPTRVTISNLKVGTSTVDLLITPFEKIKYKILKQTGDVKVSEL